MRLEIDRIFLLSKRILGVPFCIGYIMAAKVPQWYCRRTADILVSLFI